MCAEPYEDDCVGSPVKPYQQQVILHMTLQVSLIIPGEHVGLIFLRDGLPTLQIAKYMFQRFQFIPLMLVTLQVFPELPRQF